MGYPNHYIYFKMIHWDPPARHLPREFDYVPTFQASLSRLPVQDTLQFDVRCRFQIEDDDRNVLFSSLLEVTFILQEHELSEDLLVDYTQESTELYLEEFEIKKLGTYLRNLKPTWNKSPIWKNLAKTCIEQLPPRRE